VVPAVAAIQATPPARLPEKDDGVAAEYLASLAGSDSRRKSIRALRNSCTRTPSHRVRGEKQPGVGAGALSRPSGYETPWMVNDPIAPFYELGFERDRLFRGGEPRLELTRTLELLDRFLPSAPARLIDVGGGAGAYAAIWARRGYDVHLYDLMDLHVQQAQQAADAQPEHSFTAQVADARSIPEQDASADAVVLLGPLYHLTEKTHRAAALLEAHRILKPGGVIAAVGISRFSILLDGLWQGWVGDPLFRGLVERDLVDGQHRNPDPVRYPRWFTTAYFHRPEELADEVRLAGFDTVSLLGIEGPSWLMQEQWADPDRRDQMLFAARAVESEPSLSGLSAHMLAVGTKR
jgi:ubiquinone/menaquinone biosynthesis C-methylase UbiE